MDLSGTLIQTTASIPEAIARTYIRRIYFKVSFDRTADV
jgi:hypothetical protein